MTAFKERETPEETLPVERSFPGDEIGRVEIAVQIGAVRVHADETGQARVTAVRHLRGGSARERDRWRQEARVLIERQGETLVVRDVVPETLKSGSGGDRVNTRLEVEVHLPPDRAVESRVGIGACEVTGRVLDLAVDNGVGDIRLTGVACGGGRMTLHVGVGAVRATLDRLPKSEIAVKVGTGEVTLGLPAESTATVELSTGVGDVRSDLPLQNERRHRHLVGARMSGLLNGGGTALTVNVGAGGARLRRNPE